MEYKEKNIKIAKHYGYSAQIDKLKEEVAELQLALARNDLDNTKEEIADVMNMIEQYIYIMRCEEEVIKIKHEKTDRQLQRIEDEKVNFNLIV